ncbi:MAG TPA: pirin family protein, partial [Terrimicrobiaceae bacterium]|nr:pirin family protein [Terrimicrobiaceae bacterium]
MQTTTSPSRAGDPAGQQLAKLPAGERGHTDLGWLDSRHSFSFGEYFDPDHMGYRSLRVINDDTVAPGGGFGMHPHRDAEIFTYVIEGSVEHKDSMGNHGVIPAGGLQYMSAGAGVTHSECNGSRTQPVHFLQIWLRPNEQGGAPRYAEKHLGPAANADGLTLLFARDAVDGAVAIRQDAEISFGRLAAGRELAVTLESGRGLWLQIIKGRVAVLGETLAEGDGASVEGSGLV